MKPLKVISIFGTRPEAIKMAPVIKELESRKEQFDSYVVVTAQHREMLDQVLETFDIQPNIDLDIMHPNQSLSEITANVLLELEKVFVNLEPDLVLVHGDTTSSFVASLAAFYHRIPVGHVEAGLRTYDKCSPFPEEMNRQLTDVLADFYFAPTEKSKANLLKEGKNETSIFVTGNTVIDAMVYTLNSSQPIDVLENLNPANRWIVLTMHRRENQGKPMENVFRAILNILEKYADVEVIVPVHLNPIVQTIVQEKLSNHPRIHLVPPMETAVFHQVISKSFLVATDSGGIQEEAPSLGVPVLVLRDETERPEGIEAGTLRLVGTQLKEVYQAIDRLLENEQEYKKMAGAPNPYGDGKASQRISEAILYAYGRTAASPKPFVSRMDGERE